MLKAQSFSTFYKQVEFSSTDLDLRINKSLKMLLLPIVALQFLIATPVYSQSKVTWQTLADVSFTEKYSPEVEANFYYPHFGPSVKALAGKEVVLKGYMLILGSKRDFYILSRNSYASCFFCGRAGPESIVELKLKPGHPRFWMDQVVTIKGRLKLNQEDIDHCNYILEDAEPYRPN